MEGCNSLDECFLRHWLNYYRTAQPACMYAENIVQQGPLFYVTLHRAPSSLEKEREREAASTATALTPRIEIVGEQKKGQSKRKSDQEKRGTGGLEPPTSCTQSKNHTPRPCSLAISYGTFLHFPLDIFLRRVHLPRSDDDSCARCLWSTRTPGVED